MTKVIKRLMMEELQDVQYRADAVVRLAIQIQDPTIRELAQEVFSRIAAFQDALDERLERVEFVRLQEACEQPATAAPPEELSL